MHRIKHVTVSALLKNQIFWVIFSMWLTSGAKCKTSFILYLCELQQLHSLLHRRPLLAMFIAGNQNVLPGVSNFFFKMTSL